MKKLCFILSCLVLPLLVSCGNEYVYDGMYSAEYDIRSGDWVAGDTFYSVALDVREITREVVRNGSVQCFLVYSDGSQTCLPTQRFFSYEYTNDQTGLTETEYYSKMIDFEYSVGTVTIFYQLSDMYYPERPEAICIRVVVHN